MSGIGPRLWWQGRGGIIDPRRRIVPFTQALADPSFPGQGNAPTASGVDLWGVWNSYNQGPGGDTFTPGVAYDVQVDQSGNGRDVTALGGAPDASGLIYPGLRGPVSVPVCNAGNRLATANDGPDVRLDSFMLIVLSPWNASRNNQGDEWSLTRSGRASNLFSMRLSTSPSEITCKWDGFADFVGPSIAIPSVGEGNTDAWVLQAVRSTSTGPGGTATYRFMVIYDFGAGAVLAGDEAFSETESLDVAENTNDRRGNWRGVHSTGVGEKPLAALYIGADNAVFEAAMVAAASWRGSTTGTEVAAILESA